MGPIFSEISTYEHILSSYSELLQAFGRVWRGYVKFVR